MAPEVSAKAKETFHSAIQLDPQERPEFLTRACGPDTDLRLEVENLLREYSTRSVFQGPFFQPDLTGQIITHYRILETLGHGGMGVVYKAEDVKLGRTVALKFLAPHVSVSEEHRTRILHEAKALAAIDHPNICTVYEIDEAGGQVFLAMAFVDGPTLKERIAEGPLNLDEALRITIEAARGLQAAHRTGVIHRDIKSANIMLNAEGRVVITDFGLAHLEGYPGISQAVSLMGTPAYMSPEQLRGASADPRSDIWSLGVVLYEMVTGRLPFQADSLLALAQAIEDRDPEPLATLRASTPAQLERIVARMLAKNPQERYQQATDLVTDVGMLRKMLSVRRDQMTKESDLGSPGPEQTGPTGSSPVRPRWRYIVTVVPVAAVAVALLLTLRSRLKVEAPTPRLVPLTSTVGLERTPAISPDGQHFAFGWNGEAEDNFDIYVQLVEAGTPLRLTTHPGAESSPAWSPDGRFIAFYRDGPEPGTYLVPALGGSERKLADDAVPDCFTPDGALLIEKEGALHLLRLDSGEHRQLTFPVGSVTDMFGAVSPDGRWLAFARGNRVATFVDIFRTPLSLGVDTAQQPVRITHDNAAVFGIAWTADGREIVFSSARQGMNTLWRVPAFEAAPPQRVEAAGADAVWPTISRGGDRLVYMHDSQDRDVWRLPVSRRGTRIQWEEVNLQGGTPLIASTRTDQMAEYSPDGERIAFVSERSGSSEIWVCDANGQRPYAVTSFGGPPARWPHWSPDGKTLAFAGRPGGNLNIYLAPAQGGPLHLLTEDGYWPSWSRDGRWVYFASSRTGRREVWKVPAEGTGSPIQVTRKGGDVNRESPDGQFLYYAKQGRGLWRMPTAGGEETSVLESGDWEEDSGWMPLDQSILIAQRTRLLVHRFFGSPGKQPVGSRELPGIVRWAGLSLSPDERWLLITRLTRATVDVMLIDNFQ